MKGNNKGIFYGVLYVASLIYLVYAMLEFRKELIVLGSAVALNLFMTGIVVNALAVFVKSYQQKQNMLLESRLSELMNQMSGEDGDENSEILALRENTHYIKKIGEALGGFEDELIENQRKHNALLQRVITTQTKATKVLVKYNEINANKIVSGVNAQTRDISENIGNQTAAFEKQLSGLSSGLEKTVADNMGNVSGEVRRIGENVIRIANQPAPAPQMPPMMMPQMPMMPMMQQPMPMQPMQTQQAMPMGGVPQMPMDQGVGISSPQPETNMPQSFMEQAQVEAPSDMAVSGDSLDELNSVSLGDFENVSDIDASDALSGVSEEDVKAAEEMLSAEDTSAAEELLTNDNIMAALSPEPEKAEGLPGDDGGLLSQDDVSALFAALEGGESEPEPVKEEPVAKVEPEPVKEEPQVDLAAAGIPDDPNAQLSPDQIAALFAQAGGSEPEPEPVKEEPAVDLAAAGIPDDPNAQLSPDQIAALFAQAGGASEPEPEPVKEESAVDLAAAGIPDDPNAQLSPDQIAALFAQANG